MRLLGDAQEQAPSVRGQSLPGAPSRRVCLYASACPVRLGTCKQCATEGRRVPTGGGGPSGGGGAEFGGGTTKGSDSSAIPLWCMNGSAPPVPAPIAPRPLLENGSAPPLAGAAPKVLSSVCTAWGFWDGFFPGRGGGGPLVGVGNGLVAVLGFGACGGVAGGAPLLRNLCG